jgi:hypothetical protein
MAKLHGIFTTYEMRSKHENSYIKEAYFKESKRLNQKGKKK